jgi:hypothetical protein
MPLRVERTPNRRPRLAEREILVQLSERGCNPTATGLQLPARNCTRLHQIAPDCTRLRSLRQKIKKEKTRAEEKYFAPIYRPHLLACKVAEASCLLAGKVQRLDAAATFPGSLMPAPHRLSETLNLVGFNLRQSNLIQLNPG